MDEIQFLNNQQEMAFHVARLPLLRRALTETTKQVAQGFLGNNLNQKRDYEACVHRIQALARAM